MRWMALVCLAACGSGAEMRPRGRRNSTKIEALTARVDKLEGHAPAANASGDAARIEALEKRVLELETLVHEVQAKAQERANGFHPVAGPSRAPRYPGLDKDTVYALPIDDSPVIGPANAPVTLVAAVQFPEPFRAGSTNSPTRCGPRPSPRTWRTAS